MIFQKVPIIVNVSPLSFIIRKNNFKVHKHLQIMSSHNQAIKSSMIF